MAKKNRDDAPGADEVPEPNQGGDNGSEAQVSDPESHEELTVDDILNSEQNDEAIIAEADDSEHADLLLDLKRVTAEYANYRRRTEAQRQIEIDRATGRVAIGLVPVLDDLDRADKHGDLVEGAPLTAIAEKVRALAERLGVTSFGEKGEVFDPQRHEAIFQQPIPGTLEQTVLEVVETGYLLGDLELRPAKVVVAVPAE